MTIWLKLVTWTDAMWRTDRRDGDGLSRQKLVSQFLGVTLVVVALWGGFQAARWSQYQKNGWINVPNVESETP